MALSDPSSSRLTSTLDTSNVVPLGASTTTTQAVAGSGPAIDNALLAGGQMALQGAQQDMLRRQQNSVELDNAFKAGVLKGRVDATNSVNQQVVRTAPSTGDLTLANNNAGIGAANVAAARSAGALPLASQIGQTGAQAEIAANQAGAVSSGYQQRLYQALIDSGVARDAAAAQAAQYGNIKSDAEYNTALNAARTAAGNPARQAAAEGSSLDVTNAGNNANLKVLGSNLVQDAAIKGISPATVQNVVARPGAIAFNPNGTIAGADQGSIFSNVMGMRAALPTDNAAIAPSKDEQEATAAFTSAANNNQQLSTLLGKTDASGTVTGGGHLTQDDALDLISKSPFEETRNLAKGDNREWLSLSTLTGAKEDKAVNQAVADQGNLAAKAVISSVADAGARYRAPAAIRGQIAAKINGVFEPMFSPVAGKSGTYKVNDGALDPQQRASIVSLVRAANDGDADAPKQIMNVLASGLRGKPSSWITPTKGGYVPSDTGKAKLGEIARQLEGLKSSGAESALGGIQVRRDVANAIFGPGNVAPR